MSAEESTGATRSLRVAVLAGDGVGPEVTAEALKVLWAAARRFAFELDVVEFPWSADHYLATGETLPDGALERLRDDFDAIFVGAFGDPRVPDNRHAADILLGLRFGLDLYINRRPVKLYDARLCPLADRGPDDVDMVFFRENTEGAYVGAGGVVRRGTPHEVAIQEEIHTRRGVERIVRAAFEWARAHGRSKVTLCDKSNVLRHAHDLWQRVFAEVAGAFDDLHTDHYFVDALAMQMVRDPATIDVVVTNNMFGDILTDLGAALQGGLGLAASANVHPGRTSLFESVHGSAPPLAGRDEANPIAAVLSMALLLEEMGRQEAADAIEAAVVAALHSGRTTRDLGGDLGTAAAGDVLAAAVETAA
ncbi:MAG: 3-isopropylmalate dehydrogenase [Acidobacteriota bacterium]